MVLYLEDNMSRRVVPILESTHGVNQNRDVEFSLECLLIFSHGIY